jgi:hypothetical protein
MVKIENHCVGCAVPAYPCRGESCPLRKVKVHYCDKCGEELDDEIFEVDGEELCEECLKDKFRKED